MYKRILTSANFRKALGLDPPRHLGIEGLHGCDPRVTTALRPTQSKHKTSESISESGRGDWIRTSDPLRPRQVRYQAALRPDLWIILR